MTKYPHQTRDVAETFGCSRRKITALAAELGIGLNVGGRTGFRFSDDDVEAMRDFLTRSAA